MFLPPVADGGSTKGVVPLPYELPGEFFVLSYDRYSGEFTIVLDDDDKSSHLLGSDVQRIMQLFKQWDIADVGNRTIDRAREFKAAQGAPRTGQVIALFDRTGLGNPPLFKEP